MSETDFPCIYCVHQKGSNPPDRGGTYHEECLKGHFPLTDVVTLFKNKNHARGKTCPDLQYPEPYRWGVYCTKGGFEGMGMEFEPGYERSITRTKEESQELCDRMNKIAWETEWEVRELDPPQYPWLEK